MVIAMTPPPELPAYNVPGFHRSIARLVNRCVDCPELSALQVAPPSVLPKTPPPPSVYMFELLRGSITSAFPSTPSGNGGPAPSQSAPPFALLNKPALAQLKMEKGPVTAD